VVAQENILENDKADPLEDIYICFISKEIQKQTNLDIHYVWLNRAEKYIIERKPLNVDEIQLFMNYFITNIYYPL